MKRRISLLLVLLFAISVFAFAEETPQGSQFETVLLQKGSAVIKHYELVDWIATTDVWNSIKFQAATVTDLETGIIYSALRMEHGYYISQYNSGTSVGVIDSDEIDGAIKTLEYVKAHQKEMKDYTEIVYTASSGLQIGVYQSSNEQMVFFKFSSADTAYVEMKSIDSVINTLKTAQRMLGQ